MFIGLRSTRVTLDSEHLHESLFERVCLSLP